MTHEEDREAIARAGSAMTTTNVATAFTIWDR